MDTYMKKMLFTSMIVFGLSGCASNQYAVTFDTNPQGNINLRWAKFWVYACYTIL